MKKLLLIIGLGLMIAGACGTPEPGTGNPADSTNVNKSADTTATNPDTTRNQ